MPARRSPTLFKAGLVLALVAGSSACIVINEGAPAEDGGQESGGGGFDASRRFTPFDGSLRGPEPDASTSPADAGGGASSSSSSSSSSGGASSSSSTGGIPDAGFMLPDAGPDGPAACTTWEDCPPHYNDPNSAYECVVNYCQCDPGGSWASQCASLGGYLSQSDCFCVLGGGTPPYEDDNPDDNCGWDYEYYCEEDRWVDTSHYERRCETVNGNTECRDVWVNSGRWEEGGCNHVRWVWKCR